jgi:hypothetical protein
MRAEIKPDCEVVLHISAKDREMLERGNELKVRFQAEPSVPAIPAMQTVQELQDAWSAAGVNYHSAFSQACSKIGESVQWLQMVMKSRFIANTIRVREQRRGENSPIKWGIDYDKTKMLIRVMCTPTNTLVNVGTEYFMTEVGATLYRDAMGKDLNLLLTRI